MVDGTPSGTPTTDVTPTFTDVTISLPSETEWRAIFVGLVSLLADEYYWQQIQDTDQTPEEAAAWGREILARVVEDYQI